MPIPAGSACTCLTVLCATGALVGVARGALAPAAGASAGWPHRRFTAERLRPGPAPGEAGVAAGVAPDAAHQPGDPVRRVGPAAPASGGTAGAQPWPLPVSAVLFDRDGTLVHDVPYNGDPSQVRVVDDAPAASPPAACGGQDRASSPTSPGIGRGLVTTADVQP
jgi:hypothetical protein